MIKHNQGAQYNKHLCGYVEAQLINDFEIIALFLKPKKAC